MLPIAALVLSSVIAVTPTPTTIVGGPSSSSYEPGKLYYFHTSDRDVNNGVGDVEGSLAITIAADGTIVGNYRPVDDARLVDVHGSLKGDRISLYIGFDGPPIMGELRDGRIVAYALENDREHSFVGTTAPDRR